MSTRLCLVFYCEGEFIGCGSFLQLMFELCHLLRALTNQKLIGHIYFWLLQSEVYNKDVSKRFIILLQVRTAHKSVNSEYGINKFICQVYIRNCGSHRIELGHQVFVMKRLEHVAEQVKLGDTKESRLKILHERFVRFETSLLTIVRSKLLFLARLKEIVLPATFKLPLNPHLKVTLSVLYFPLLNAFWRRCVASK